MSGQIFTVICCMCFVVSMGVFVDLLRRYEGGSPGIAIIWNGVSAGVCLALIVLRPFG